MDDVVALDLMSSSMGVLGIFALYGAWRLKQRLTRPVSYLQDSAPATAEWRWREPPDWPELAHRDGVAGPGIRVEQAAASSILHLPTSTFAIARLWMAVGLGLCALAMALLAMFIYHSIDNDITVESWSLALVFLGLAWIGLRLQFSGSRVLRIELRPDMVILVANVSFGLHWNYVCAYSPALEFRGRQLSIADMTWEHDIPDFALYVDRRRQFWLRKSRRLLLTVNPTQGQWLLGGLQAWLAVARRST